MRIQLISKKAMYTSKRLHYSDILKLNTNQTTGFTLPFLFLTLMCVILLRFKMKFSIFKMLTCIKCVLIFFSQILMHYHVKKAFWTGYKTLNPFALQHPFQSISPNSLPPSLFSTVRAIVICHLGYPSDLSILFHALLLLESIQNDLFKI